MITCAFRCWLAAVVLFLAALRPAVAADSVILAADHWCPHTCDPAGGPPGYMVEIAREALALAGIRTVYQLRPWSTAMSDVRAGLIDGVVGTLASEAPDLSHNHRALGRQANAFVVRVDDPLVLAGLDSLGQRRIATVRDYSYSPTIDSWLAAHAAQVTAQPGNRAADNNLDRLLNQKVDVVIDDEAVLRDAVIRLGLGAKVRVAGRQSGGPLHIAFSQARQYNRDLGALLDDGIAKLRRSGRLAEILAAYGLADWETER